MKKRLLAVIMCVTMSACLLAGCGSDEEVPATDMNVTDEADEVEDEAEEAYEDDAEDDGEGCSDETFADLQEAFASLTEEYDMVVDFYNNNDDIPQDDEVEEALATAKDYLEQVAEVEQTSISEEEAQELGQSMIDVANGLATLAEGLGIMSEAGATASDVCSDETFAALQEAFSYLSEEYNTIVDFYKNNDSIPQNDEVETALASAKEYLEQMGEVEQASISESDAETLAQTMLDVATALEQLAGALAQ